MSTVYADALKDLAAGLSSLGIGSGRLLFLHVRLKSLCEALQLDYADCTRLVLDAAATLSPKAVLVPGFTYSFTQSGVFHRQFSRSETGRFSEEVRQHYAGFRTGDPMFSIMDTMGWIEQREDQFVTDVAFGSGTIWELLLDNDCAIVNIGLPHLIATQVHHLERLMNVPYRETIIKTGVVYDTPEIWRPVSFRFFARKLDWGMLLDWPRIASILESDGCLTRIVRRGVTLAMVGAKALHNALSPNIAADPYAIVRKD